MNTNRFSVTAYYADLINALKKDKYFVSNVTIRGAPYDFRKIPGMYFTFLFLICTIIEENEQFYSKLKLLTEETYHLGQKRRVILLCHSMGCLFTLGFINNQTNEWKQKYIEAFVSTSAPLGGSLKALKIEASGKQINFI